MSGGQLQLHTLGDLNKTCQFCNALYFTKETYHNLCCKKIQVVLPPVKEPHTYLRELCEFEAEETCHFRDNVCTYNGALTFESLKANTVIVHEKSCYIAQGHVYSDASDCLPRSGQPPSRNQLWFVEIDESAATRCAEFDVLIKPVHLKNH